MNIKVLGEGCEKCSQLYEKYKRSGERTGNRRGNREDRGFNRNCEIRGFVSPFSYG